LPARPKPGSAEIVQCSTVDDLVSMIIKAASEMDKHPAQVSVMEMRRFGVTDRNINELGGIRKARSKATGDLAAVPIPTPKEAAEKAVRQRPKRKKPAWKRGESRKIEGWRTVAIISDIHVPEQDAGCLGACIAWLKDVRPDIIIINGDIGEWESMSVFSNGGLMALEDEIGVVGWLLDKITEASPSSEVVINEGNHETRLPRWIARNAPQLDGIITIPDKLRLEDRGIRWVPEDEQPYSIGGLDVIHGHQDLKGWGPIYAARKFADLHGRPGRVVVYGHTHKHQAFDRPHSQGVSRAIGLPCMRSLRPGWTHGRTNAWSHGWGLAHVSDTSARVELVTYADGVALYGGRAYR